MKPTGFMSTAINRRYLLVLLLCGLLWSCRDKHRLPDTQNPDKLPMLPFISIYYDYGGPPEPAFAKAQKSVLARYGLAYYGFGCEVTDSLIRAIHRHNDSLFTRLRPTHPGLGEDRLRQEIQAYIATQKQDGNVRYQRADSPKSTRYAE